jgi:hypothetical protein
MKATGEDADNIDDRAKAESILKNALQREEELRKEFEASEGGADAVENIFAHAAENEQAMRAQLETLSIDAAETEAIIKTAVLSSPSNKKENESSDSAGKNAPVTGLPYLRSPQKPITEIIEHLGQIENLWENDAEEMTKISLALSFIHYVLFNQEGGGAVALKAWHVMSHGAWQKCYIMVLTSTGFFQIQSDSNLHSAKVRESSPPIENNHYLKPTRRRLLTPISHSPRTQLTPATRPHQVIEYEAVK